MPARQSSLPDFVAADVRRLKLSKKNNEPTYVGCYLFDHHPPPSARSSRYNATVQARSALFRRQCRFDGFGDFRRVGFHGRSEAVQDFAVTTDHKLGEVPAD